MTKILKEHKEPLSVNYRDDLVPYTTITELHI